MMNTESMGCANVLYMPTTMKESSLASLKMLSSKLTDIAANHFAIQHAREQVSHSSKPWMQSAMASTEQPAPATMVTSHTTHPPGTAPVAHDSIQSAEQTALQGIPDAPNATRLDTGDQNAVVASNLNQRMHLQLGHSVGSPDAHLGATAAALTGVVKLMP